MADPNNYCTNRIGVLSGWLICETKLKRPLLHEYTGLPPFPGNEAHSGTSFVTGTASANTASPPFCGSNKLRQSPITTDLAMMLFVYSSTARGDILGADFTKGKNAPSPSADTIIGLISLILSPARMLFSSDITPTLPHLSQ